MRAVVKVELDVRACTGMCGTKAGAISDADGEMKWDEYDDGVDRDRSCAV